MTNTQPTPFDKQKLKALKSEITQTRKATCSLSHALSRGTARHELIVAQFNAHDMLTNSLYSYLASLAHERIRLIDTNAISILCAYGDYMDLSLFYAEITENLALRDIIKDMIKSVNQAMLGEEEDRFELLSDLVRAGLVWQEAKMHDAD